MNFPVAHRDGGTLWQAGSWNAKHFHSWVQCDQYRQLEKDKGAQRPGSLPRERNVRASDGDQRRSAGADEFPGADQGRNHRTRRRSCGKSQCHGVGNCLRNGYSISMPIRTKARPMRATRSISLRRSLSDVDYGMIIVWGAAVLATFRDIWWTRRAFEICRFCQ